MAYKEFANIYDELIYEDINYDKVSGKIIDLCNKNNVYFEDYLDLACGTGNVAVKIAKYFKNTYAVDLSNDMLNIAFDKFKKNKIKAKVICQDMSELNLNKKFNLITSVLDSTNYIIKDEELVEYFSKVYEHLKDGGLFIFDINSYYKLSTVLGNNIYTYSSDEIFYTWENSFEEDVLNMFLSFFVKQDNGLYEKFEEEHFERAYKEEYIEQVLEACGFKLLGKFAGYSDQKVDGDSERILYVIKKNS
jgi:SAM-dependent methyltransferase